MSVPTYKRAESKVEFISTARELVLCGAKYGEIIAKRHRYFGAIEPYNLAVKMFDCLVAGNSRDVKTEYEKRTEYFKQALDYLECLSSHISLLSDYVELSDNKWEHWGILIATEKKLINGILKSDKERINS